MNFGTENLNAVLNVIMPTNSDLVKPSDLNIEFTVANITQFIIDTVLWYIVVYIGIVILIILILIQSYKIIISQEPANRNKAIMNILYSIAGYIVIVGAYTFVSFIFDFISGIVA